MSKQSTAPSAGKGLQFLFLASHGLQSPLSAIRWGATRLKRTGGRLPKPQKNLVDHIESNARTLSRVLGSMLLLARNEDESYVPKPKKIDLAVFVKEMIAEAKVEGVKVQGKAKKFVVETDELLLTTIMSNLLGVLATAGNKKGAVQLSVDRKQGFAMFTFVATLEFPVIEAQSSDGMHEHVNQMIGGEAGLMLALSSSLINFLDGFLEMKEGKKKAMYTITVGFPVTR